MSGTIFLAIGYALLWLMTFIFMYSIVNRQRTLEKKLALLEQLTQADSQIDG